MLKKWLQRRSREPRVLAIVGMHRSGTSLLTGSLQQAGLELHRFHEHNPHNRKGNRENQDIVELNNAVLDANGGSWDKPPQDPVWSEEHLARGRRIISEYGNYPLWGFKDPRTLITLAGWHGLVPQLELVGIFRHPLAVAQSLRARNDNIGIEQGLTLWQAYNERLLAQYQRQAFPLLCFETTVVDPVQKMQQLANHLRLPDVQSIAFFDPELVNQTKADEQTLPPETESLYQQLRGIAFG